MQAFHATVQASARRDKFQRSQERQLGRWGCQGRETRNWKEEELGNEYPNYDTNGQREPGGQSPKDILAGLGFHDYRIRESDGGEGAEAGLKGANEFFDKGVRFSVKIRLNVPVFLLCGLMAAA